MRHQSTLCVIIFVILVFPILSLPQTDPPKIAEISPVKIIEGKETVLTILGEHFGTRDPGNRTFVSSDDNMFGPGLKIITWTDTRIEGTFPYFLQPGKYNIFILSSGLASTPRQVEVTAVPSPVIESIDPETGIPGAAIRVKGKNFGISSDHILALRRFSAGEFTMIERLKISSWYPGEIFAHISDTIAPGSYTLSMEGGEKILSRKQYTIVKPVPVIKTLSPQKVFDGDEPIITLSGTYFGETEKNRMVVITDDTVSSKRFLPVQLWSDNMIKVSFPFDQDPGKYYLYVYTPPGGKSNYASLQYMGKPTPKITRLTPWEGFPGSIVYIHGHQFGNGERYQLVMWKIGDEQETERESIEPSAWSNDRIDMVLNDNLVPGAYILGIREIKTGKILTDFAFKIKPVTVNKE